MWNVVMDMRTRRGGRRAQSLARVRCAAACRNILDAPSFMRVGHNEQATLMVYANIQQISDYIQLFTRTSGAIRSSTLCSFDPQTASLCAS